MRDCFVKHEAFPCDAAYTSEASTSSIYNESVQPMLKDAISGGIATIFAFGQTGSGKTYTMRGIEEQAGEELMSLINKTGGYISVAFFEIAGRTVTDLLGEPGSLLQLREDSKGKIQTVGVHEPSVSNIRELLEVIELGKSRRATEATNVNAGSSRSHAILKLGIHRPGMPVGKLMLVDCAGSERKEDSMYHSAERRKETSEINASLHSLKECFRAMASGNADTHVPYRSSNLTKVLMETLTTPDARTLMIATLSPTATDTEHSISTLRTIATLTGSESLITERKDELQGEVFRPNVSIPAKWSHNEVASWLSQVEGERYRGVVEELPKTVDGKQFTRWPVSKFTALCSGKEAHGQKLYKALRSEMDRVNLIQKQAREVNRSRAQM